MTSTRDTIQRVAAYAVALSPIATCGDPFVPDTTPVAQLEDCAASTEWLPGPGQSTPPVPMFMPLPHPTTECPFYRGGWQNFLIATEPADAKGTPRLVSFPTIETVFTPKVPPAGTLSYLGDVKQAGRREIAIDQNGYTLYYSIHMNQAFADFIHANHLETAKAIQDYMKNPSTKNLFFPAGVAEFKAAWQIVDKKNPPADLDEYITIDTTAPTLRTTTDANGKKHIEEHRELPRPVTVRLLALHVVYTLPGHPEFIWASFEHSHGAPDASAADGKRDVAPTLADFNPTPTDPNNRMISMPVSGDDFILYKGGTSANTANTSFTEDQLQLDEPSQRFLGPGGMPQTTSIYRMFPASKSNVTDPDDAITSLNHNVEALFKQAEANNKLAPADKRKFYRLVGAQWMDKPRYFKLDSPIQNDASSPFAEDPSPNGVGIGKEKLGEEITKDGSDSPYSILAGEDRMSSTAMESFTQAPGSFNNCFTCHNTQAITLNGIPLDNDKAGIKILDPGLLNVSHILSSFVASECGSNVVTSPDGSKAIVCN